jgi:hypothetical protein
MADLAATEDLLRRIKKLERNNRTMKRTGAVL